MLACAGGKHYRAWFPSPYRLGRDQPRERTNRTFSTQPKVVPKTCNINTCTCIVVSNRFPTKMIMGQTRLFFAWCFGTYRSSGVDFCFRHFSFWLTISGVMQVMTWIIDLSICFSGRLENVRWSAANLFSVNTAFRNAVPVTNTADARSQSAGTRDAGIRVPKVWWIGLIG